MIEAIHVTGSLQRFVMRNIWWLNLIGAACAAGAALVSRYDAIAVVNWMLCGINLTLGLTGKRTLDLHRTMESARVDLEKQLMMVDSLIIDLKGANESVGLWHRMHGVPPPPPTKH